MPQMPIFLLVSLLFAFIVSYLITPFIISRMKKRGIVGVDMNKYSKPSIPEMGGIGVFFGIAFGVMAAISANVFFGFVELDLSIIFAGMLTILLVGFIGLVDDLIGWRNGIRQWQHALFPVLAALPLMVSPSVLSSTTISIPFFGEVYVGIFYAVFLVPLAVTGASNAVNMLAGMNGLEAGLGAIISATMLLILLFLSPEYDGKFEGIVLLCAILGALIAFYYFNKFPAKIFGGDSLTLMIGASLATASIIARIEVIGVLLFALYFAELVLKGKHKMQSESFGIPQRDGTLKPRPEGGSLTQLIMRKGSFTEKQVVSIILGAQAIISLVVLMLVYFKWV